jgi:DNA polymerase-3 subunit delta
MSYEKIIADLQNKKYAPVYFLHGEETYYIDKISDYIEQKVLTEDEKEFNQTVFYGKDTDISSLISAAKRFPMMSQFQVVMLKEAQEMKSLIMREDDKGSKHDPLISYLDNPLQSTILVICYMHKKLDGRTKLSAALKKKSVFFESERIKDHKIPAWVTQYAQSKAFRIHSQAASLLAEYLGNDLTKVSNELDKIMLNVKQDTEINSTHIEKFVGISKDFNVFELQNALSAKNILKIYRIVDYFAANPKNNPIIMVIANLFSYFSKIMLYHTSPSKDQGSIASLLKIPPFAVSEYATAAKAFPIGKTVQVISLLREYDMKSKGFENVATDDGELLKELMYKILH